MGKIDYKELVNQLQAKYTELCNDYLRVCEDNQKLQAKLEECEINGVYVKERDEELRAKLHHYEMMFTDAERNRQMLAAQMDVVYLIFGKKN